MSSLHTRTRKWKVNNLKGYPWQPEIFGDIPEAELEALAADMDKNGQRQPVEILPGGIVVCGHQRVRAAKLLGWEEIEVVVRHDLALQGDDVIEAHFIGDNLVRRHLSPLARARCIRRLMEIESGSQRGGLGWVKKEKLKAKIAKQLHLSPRSVDRYLLLLDGPVSIQQAFDRGEISLVQAGKLALLYRKDRRKFAGIEHGKDVKNVVAELLGKHNSRHRKVGHAVASFLRSLERGQQDLEGRVDDVRPAHLVTYVETLRQAHALIATLLKKATK